MVIPKTRREPVSKQPRREPVPVIAIGEVAVVHENLNRVGHPSADVFNKRIVLPLQAAPRTGCEDVLGCGVRENLHRNGKRLVFQSILQARLVVDQINLTKRPQ